MNVDYFSTFTYESLTLAIIATVNYASSSEMSQQQTRKDFLPLEVILIFPSLASWKVTLDGQLIMELEDTYLPDFDFDVRKVYEIHHGLYFMRLKPNAYLSV